MTVLGAVVFPATARALMFALVVGSDAVGESLPVETDNSAVGVNEPAPCVAHAAGRLTIPGASRLAFT